MRRGNSNKIDTPARLLLYRLLSFGWGAPAAKSTIFSGGAFYGTQAAEPFQSYGAGGGTNGILTSPDGQYLHLTNPTNDLCLYGDSFNTPSMVEAAPGSSIEAIQSAEMELTASQAGAVASFHMASSVAPWRGNPGAVSGYVVGFFFEPTAFGNNNWWIKSANNGVYQTPIDTGLTALQRVRLGFRIGNIGNTYFTEFFGNNRLLTALSSVNSPRIPYTGSAGATVWNLGTSNAASLRVRRFIRSVYLTEPALLGG